MLHSRCRYIESPQMFKLTSACPQYPPPPQRGYVRAGVCWHHAHYHKVPYDVALLFGDFVTFVQVTRSCVMECSQAFINCIIVYDAV